MPRLIQLLDLEPDDVPLVAVAALGRGESRRVVDGLLDHRLHLVLHFGRGLAGLAAVVQLFLAVVGLHEDRHRRLQSSG